ncbi:MAG: hypothetical protein ACWGMZ_02225 [Thermoguttaceae bacterium]
MQAVPSVEQVGIVYPNPASVPITNPQCLWEVVVDVVDDYFKIKHEEPVRQIGEMTTEGRIETFAEISPTLFEPWRRDTAGEYERVENTLQTMRRYAVIKVINGHWVEVAVYKELEDLPAPEHSSAGSATFRYDNSFTRVENPAGEEHEGQCWIPQGRDRVLEQRILGHLLTRCNETTSNGAAGPVIIQ